MSYSTFHIYTPPAWEMVVLTVGGSGVRSVYMYSPTYFFQLALPYGSTHARVASTPSVIALTLPYNYNFTRLYLVELRKVVALFYRPTFMKLKFKGKGYYIYKNKRNTITPQFGYSHRLYTYAYFVNVKFLSKTSIFVYGYLKSDIVDIAGAVRAMRPINIFTGRGVRFSRQIIYKKAGKISSYR